MGSITYVKLFRVETSSSWEWRIAVEAILVNGKKRLTGRIRVSGAKNSSLPVLAATLLAPGLSQVENVPKLKDLDTMSAVLSELGAKVVRDRSCIKVDASRLNGFEPDYELVRAMRASVLVMGPLLSRMGRVKISLPGGCAIGSRPIDLHLKGFAALGASIDMEHGAVEAKVNDVLRGDRIYLDFPSVGATENIMMAAVMARGTTIIENAAQEPEIVDLANILNTMGGKVRGAGTTVLRITGVDDLRPTSHMVIPDRVEAGTYMAAAAITQGDLIIDNVLSEHLKPMVAKLRESGVHIEENENSIRVACDRRPVGVDVKTMPYPGFPTDLQAQFMAFMTLCEGSSLITETVFENRFMHVSELCRMGANIRIDGRTALVQGQSELFGTNVRCTDLRAGAALVISALAAEGDTYIYDICHIDRGYEGIERKLAACGADIKRIDTEAVAHLNVI